jgi:hypothetical protein
VKGVEEKGRGFEKVEERGSEEETGERDKGGGERVAERGRPVASTIDSMAMADQRYRGTSFKDVQGRIIERADVVVVRDTV